MFLYFVPGKHTIGRHELADLGLGYALDRECHFHACHVSGTGPSGGQGVVFAVSTGPDPGANAARCNVDLPKQTWRQIPSVSCPLSPVPPPMWVGHWNDSLPGPDELARQEQL